MARTPKVYDDNELRRMRIVEQARAHVPVGSVREAAQYMALHLYDGELTGWERETLAVAVAEVVMQKLDAHDSTTLGEELWLMLSRAAREGRRYEKTADEALTKAGEYIEAGEVSRWARAVVENIS